MERLIHLGPVEAIVTGPSRLLACLDTFPEGTGSEKITWRLSLQESSSPILPLPAGTKTRIRNSGGKLRFETAFFRGTADASFKNISVEIGPSDEVLETPNRRVYGALRFLLCSWVAQHGGLTMHGCSLARNAGAHVFVGESGAGKTTLASQFPSDGILGDDLVVLLPRGEEYLVVGTPFSGREGLQALSATVPLKTISLLHQGERTTAEPLGVQESVPGLLRHTFQFDREPTAHQHILQRVVDVAQRVPVYRTHISLEESPWSLEVLQ